MKQGMNGYKNVDEYIENFSGQVQKKLTKIREVIRKNAPEANEAISYGMPTFKLNGNLVHFAAYKSHIGFYPTPSAIEAFSKELAKYKCSKGAIQFPIDKPVPFDLVKKIIRFRVLQNLRRK